MTHFSRISLKRTLLGALTATVLVGGLSACAGNRHEYGANMSAEQYAQKRDKMVDKAASKLDLNEDQKKRLSVLGDKLFEQRTALIGQSSSPRAEMKALVAGEKFDAVDRVVDERHRPAGLLHAIRRALIVRNGVHAARDLSAGVRHDADGKSDRSQLRQRIEALRDRPAPRSWSEPQAGARSRR